MDVQRAIVAEWSAPKHVATVRCRGSFLALYDFLPMADGKAYITAIYVIRDRREHLVGWAYKSQTGKWWLQAAPGMTASEVAHVHGELPTNPGARRFNVSPISAPKWDDLTLGEECH
jgi:hypothetical protein